MDEGIRGAGLALARGTRVSAALGDAGLSDTVAAGLLAVGERTGNFDRVLLTIAERHAGMLTTFVERATRNAGCPAKPERHAATHLRGECLATAAAQGPVLAKGVLRVAGRSASLCA